MPVCPLTVASMLACARIGAVHSVLFSRFNPALDDTDLKRRGYLYPRKSPQALVDIITKAKVIITANEAPNAKKPLLLKENLDDVILKKKLSVKKILVSRRTDTGVPMTEKRDEWLEEAMMKEPKICKPEPMDSEDDLFILFTSGSSGIPKGIIHTQAGYLLHVATTFKYYFGRYLQPGDVYACIADIGWITGHSYVVYGPLCNGATTVLFDNTEAYTNPTDYWEMIQRLGIKAFYTTPAMIRSVMSIDRDSVIGYNTSSLQVIASVGEPLSKDAWDWYRDKVGKRKCHVMDTWWQTELGGICMATPDDMTADLRMKPSFGVEPVIYNKGQKNANGNLYLKCPLPGMARKLFRKDGDKDAIGFKAIDGQTMYSTCDIAHRDKGGYQIIGREKDVIMVAGKLINIPLLEGQIATVHDDVVEVAIVVPKLAPNAGTSVMDEANGTNVMDEVSGTNVMDEANGTNVMDEVSGTNVMDEVNGADVTDKDIERVSVYVSVAKYDTLDFTDEDRIYRKTKEVVMKNLGVLAYIRILPKLEKTYSGKIVRYILRDMYTDDAFRKFGTTDKKVLAELSESTMTCGGYNQTYVY